METPVLRFVDEVRRGDQASNAAHHSDSKCVHHRQDFYTAESWQEPALFIVWLVIDEILIHCNAIAAHDFRHGLKDWVTRKATGWHKASRVPPHQL